MIVLLLAGLIALAVLILTDLDVGLPEFPAAQRRPDGAAAPISVSEIENVLSPARYALLIPPTNSLNPFYTTYFQPPAPKPPTTRKVELTYQGFYRNAEGQKRAFVKIGDRLFVGPVGSNVVADLSVVDISLRTLTLRNAAQTNTLEFNTRKELEIPVQ